MPSVSLTGQDTVQINGITFATLADGAAFEITFPNELGMAKRAKNGNMIFAKAEAGGMADISLRVLIGAVDDQYLTSLLELWRSGDTSTFPLMTAVFVKRVGDGAGNTISKIYQCSGGYFKKGVSAKTTAEGDTEQSVSVYALQFAFCQVSHQ